MGWFDFLLNLTTEDKITLLVWFIIQVIPFIALAIVIKKRVKVGSIDTYTFIVYFGLALFIGYLAISSLIGEAATMEAYANFAGLFFGLILFSIVFNHITESVKKTFIIEFQIEQFNVNVDFCYTYEHKGRTCIIKKDEEGNEPFWELLKRVFGIRTYLDVESTILEFREHNVNRALLCTESKETIRKFNENGVMKERNCLAIKPIPTLKYNQIEFLVRFRNYNAINEDLARVYDEKMLIERNIYVIAKRLMAKWADHLEEALFGDLTIRKILEQLQKLGYVPEYEGETEDQDEAIEQQEIELPEDLAEELAEQLGETDDVGKFGRYK